MKKITLLCFLCLLCYSCTVLKITQTTLGEGWSNNSVNVVVFRNSALTTHGNTQFAAYYAPDSVMVLAKRKLGTANWQLQRTSYKGNVKDAHNDISIAVDAKGYLHVSWDHHDTRLRYVRSSTPLGLDLGKEMPMTGKQEEKVTYPEFHNLPDGKLLFCYRSGKSGRGNMVMNIYTPETQSWQQVQNNLLDGEGHRSAYWQMCTGPKGLYLSWTWRESWDVSTNHDICYAFSPDGGKTWQKSNGTVYTLPITLAAAETVWNVPQKSSLINQTAMAVDTAGNPYIGTYWDSGKGPQYKVVYRKDGNWQLLDSDFITTPFSLGGGGTKSIPISRPQLLVQGDAVYLLFRDAGRDNHVSVGIGFLQNGTWKIKDIVSENVGQWEPNYDKALWQAKQELHVFCQKVSQTDGEGLSSVTPEPVKVVEVNKFRLLKK
jgi:hypothetical protein